MKKLILLFAVILALGSINETKATHIQGINGQYRHIGGDTFVVYFDFFRYCGGSLLGGSLNPAGAPNTIFYTVYCPDVGFQVSRQADTLGTKEATPLCQSLQSTCEVGGANGVLGIQWYYYSDTLIFSELAVSTCSEWVMFYSTGARNPGTNYVGQPSIATFTTFRQQTDPTNSSIQFNSPKPIPFFCAGQQVTYNWGAIELDGDSLYWELDTAAAGYSTISGPTPMNYNPGYSGLQPMPGVTIDNATGELSFIAEIPAGFPGANYAVAVKVSEYNPNTGDLLAVTQRDVQFIVTDSCNNNPPTQDTNGITNFNGSGALVGPTTVEVCFGQSFDFELIYTDFDTAGNISGDSISVECNIADALPGATWSHTGTNPDTVSVQWTAVPTNITLAPFNITVEDDFCPVTSFNIYNILVKITPSTIVPSDTQICTSDTGAYYLPIIGGDSFWFTSVMNPDSTFGPPLIAGQNIECNPCFNNDSPWLDLDSTTTIAVESNLSATCGNKDTITYEVFSAYPIDITPVSGGTPGGLVYCEIDDLDTLNGLTPGGTWFGPGIVNAVDGVFAPDIFSLDPGQDTTVDVSYVISGFCPNQATAQIRVKGTPDASITTVGPYCVQLTNVQLAGPDSTGVWSGLNVTSTGILDPTAFAATAPDTILVHHTINDSGCVAEDSAEIVLIGQFEARIDSLPKICSGEQILVNLDQYEGEGDLNGVWTGENIIQDSLGQHFFDARSLRAGSYDITLTIPGSCGTSRDTTVIINPLPDATIFGADSVYCDNIQDSVLLTAATESGIWGGSMTELHDGYFVPFEIGEGVYDITYELYDTITACYNKNTVPVRIARTPVQPSVFGGTYCQGTNVDVRADGLLSNTFKWFGVSNGDSVLLGAGNPFNYGEVIDMPTIVYATQVSKDGCESITSRLEIEVLPAPLADFEADSTFGNVPFEVNFTNLSGPDTSELFYTWTFADYEERYVDTASAPQSFVFEEIGTYTVTLLADNSRCVHEKTISITADRLTKFFIPNVFTPDGDGFNDQLEWKIDGIGDFRITIYNRWGNRVFVTDNPDEFWDGGSEPSGSYYYVMTGSEKTLDEEPTEWRGNITLIRGE